MSAKLLRLTLLLLIVCFVPAPGALAQTFVDLHDFNPFSIGTCPAAALVQGADGSFYGTASGVTNAGDATNDGAIYKITRGGAVTTLHQFSGPDGAFPYGNLVQASDGNFYGTTSNGGATSVGTVFQVTPGGVLTTLHQFSGPDGAWPTGRRKKTRRLSVGATFSQWSALPLPAPACLMMRDALSATWSRRST